MEQIKPETARLRVYLTKYSTLDVRSIHKATQQELGNGLWITPHDHSNDKDYTLVGYADTAITLLPPADLVKTQVAALEQQIVAETRDSATRVMKMRQQINSLLAIENVPSGVES